VGKSVERQVADWWQTVAEHETRGGVCVLCKERKCRPRAEALKRIAAVEPPFRGGTPPYRA